MKRFNFKLRDGERLRIQVREYKGKSYLDARVFYDVTEDDKEGKPGKGFTVHHTRAAPLMEKLAAWAGGDGLAMAEELYEIGEKQEATLAKGRRDD